MQEGIFTIAENHALTGSIMRMKLLGDTEAIQRPGQFVNIRLPDRYLRRPLSVCDVDSMSFSVIYKTVGKGTYYMSTLQKGLRLDILTGLGNGFNLDRAGRNPLLIGGGTGVAPLYYLAKACTGARRMLRRCLDFRMRIRRFSSRNLSSCATMSLSQRKTGASDAGAWSPTSFRKNTVSSIPAVRKP